MSLSDCPQCWNTPCTCGHDYQDWSEEAIREQIAMLERVLGEKIKKEKDPYEKNDHRRQD